MLQNVYLPAMIGADTVKTGHFMVNFSTKFGKLLAAAVGLAASQKTSQSPPLPARAEPDLSAESTPTGRGCQMKQASIFFRAHAFEEAGEHHRKQYQNFTNFHSANI